MDEEDYMGYQEMPPFGANVPLPIIQEGDESAYVRLDHNEALIVDAPKDSYIIVNYVIIMHITVKDVWSWWNSHLLSPPR